MQKLSRLRKAVRHKYALLRRGRADTREVISKTFEPMIKPLEKLVHWTEGKKKNNQSDESRTTKSPQHLEESNSDDEGTIVNVSDTESIDGESGDSLVSGY